MELPLYQVDAFASLVFEGNPAAVVPLDHWLPGALMQSIAAENNLAETAFFVPDGSGFRIRWFTPTAEVKLCGHATLASAFVLYEQLGWSKDQITFQSLSGPLMVARQGDLFELDFPSQPGKPCAAPRALIDGLGVEPQAVLRSEDYVVILKDAAQVASIRPDFSALLRLDLRCVVVTAPAQDYDFVVRVFAPKYGIPEDPVTGSAYTQLAPYWAERLNKQTLQARQVSSRGGDVRCELCGDRVKIAGKAILYMKGQIGVED